MSAESETIFHRDSTNDSSAKARHCDDDQQWTVESYDAGTTKAMRAAGATEQPGAFGDATMLLCLIR